VVIADNGVDRSEGRSPVAKKKKKSKKSKKGKKK
jgi:hypothetical protein